MLISFFIYYLIGKNTNREKPNSYPELKLSGDTIININVGDKYTELGYTAYDSKDKDITNKVEIKNNVNENIPGTYEIIYKVTNSKGNSIEVKRFVKVKLTKDFTYKEEYNNIDNKTLGWGTNNKKDGNRPNTDVSNEELKKYNAYAMGPDKKVIYLTFDEGTMTSYLPQIVEVLNKNNVKGTFFLCKNYIKNNKELINKMLDSGHSIGNHTASHLSMPSLASKENFSKYLEEIISVEDTFKEVTGREIDKIYREPRGEFSKRSLSIMKDLGYSTYFWSSAYKDWDDKLTKEEALSSMIERVHNGAIFLLHPTSKGNYLALEEFIKTMKSKGYIFDLVKNI